MKNGDKPISAIWNPDMNLGDTAGPGLTKREYFAAMALQGLIASEVTASVSEFVSKSVDLADALLAELEK